MPHILSILLLTLFLYPVAVAAEVLDSSAGGFTSQSTATIAASPAEVYAKLVQGVGVWWSSDHTVSGKAANLQIDATQGGCFCESLPTGGKVQHLSVVHADPGRLLRMQGGLGPLQSEGVTGSLSWALAEIDGGTQVTVTYAVGGYVSGGLDAWAEGVDRVVNDQLARLARYVATGDPEEPSAEHNPGEKVD